MKQKIALSIAGSDPSGGAGIQADLKAFASLGLHGTTVVTCITAQNTQRVKEIHKLPINVIEKQFDVLLEDFKIDAAKVGMLYDREIVRCIAKKIKKYNLKSVVDPVMVATNGDALPEENFVAAMKKELIPHTHIITPNIHEAQVLSERKIKTIEDVKEACSIIFEMGPQYVLITGWHLDGSSAKDVLFNGKEYAIFSLPKLPGKKPHGSGCTFSSLIAGLLALGERPNNAVERAKNILWNMIYYGYDLGKGADILNNSLNVANDAPYSLPTDDHFNTWLELKKAVDTLVPLIPREYIPEVGMNVGYAQANAKTRKDICAIDGRIVKTQGGAIRCGKMRFGSSKHIASIILAVMAFNPNIRCALNIRYSKDNLKDCEKAGFSVGSFDRRYEPSTISSTMEWGTKDAITRLNHVPDIIYDTGAIGKEPMIRFLGKNPKDTVDKIRKLSENLKKY
ncbi:MAG: bifunctional hydroxymethylpyrimidine kinase/phosphomethylpyrimidine kinase [Candidatus Thermoplasmatota archaeon]|nr:bifunctional hydroxymethylpyrimidine kinase/phosphomethylpyrimidine kinase [Candidatus Thermoplasmatota archaeon]